ncbi:hypothetical protein V6N11_057890 [Hibiscus sabdariffa]|uniref:BED-type domain-containing protein n=1 Tax=Hibiscus sabdariffa TaxID=183260 RepID=A0ABR2P412_9ROSI
MESRTSTGSSDKLDPARKYGKQDPTNRNNFTCDFCGKVSKGGVYRMKQHLLGGFKNVLDCLECPEHVKEEIKTFMLKKAELKATHSMLPLDSFVVDEYDQEDEQECETLNSSGVPSQKSGKKPRHKGPMDLFVTPKAHPKKDEGGVHAACAKKLREKASRSIASDGLTWSHVSKAIGAHEPSYLTRTSMVMKESFRPSSSKSAKEKNVPTSSSAHGRDDEMEEDIGEDDFAVDEDYNDEFDDSE